MKAKTKRTSQKPTAPPAAAPTPAPTPVAATPKPVKPKLASHHDYVAPPPADPGV